MGQILTRPLVSNDLEVWIPPATTPPRESYNRLQIFLILAIGVITFLVSSSKSKRRRARPRPTSKRAVPVSQDGRKAVRREGELEPVFEHSAATGLKAISDLLSSPEFRESSEKETMVKDADNDDDDDDPSPSEPSSPTDFDISLVTTLGGFDITPDLHARMIKEEESSERSPVDPSSTSIHLRFTGFPAKPSSGTTPNGLVNLAQVILHAPSATVELLVCPSTNQEDGDSTLPLEPLISSSDLSAPLHAPHLPTSLPSSAITLLTLTPTARTSAPGNTEYLTELLNVTQPDRLKFDIDPDFLFPDKSKMLIPMPSCSPLIIAGNSIFQPPNPPLTCLDLGPYIPITDGINYHFAFASWRCKTIVIEYLSNRDSGAPIPPPSSPSSSASSKEPSWDPKAGSSALPKILWNPSYGFLNLLNPRLTFFRRKGKKKPVQMDSGTAIVLLVADEGLVDDFREFVEGFVDSRPRGPGRGEIEDGGSDRGRGRERKEREVGNGKKKSGRGRDREEEDGTRRKGDRQDEPRSRDGRKADPKDIRGRKDTSKGTGSETDERDSKGDEKDEPRKMGPEKDSSTARKSRKDNPKGTDKRPPPAPSPLGRRPSEDLELRERLHIFKLSLFYVLSSSSSEEDSPARPIWSGENDPLGGHKIGCGCGLCV